MRLYKSYQLLVLLLFPLVFSACLDDPVKTNDSVVTGTVYDQLGMYNPYVKVSVGDYPIVAADVYGKFTLENNQFPYNITVSNIHYATNKYIGLTIPEPHIITLNDYGYSNTCYVNVFFPSMTSENDNAIIKFISNDNYTQFDDYVLNGSEFNFNVGIMNDKQEIEGKLIFLQFKTYYEIDAYVKFGIKDVVLHRGSQNIYFSEEDVKYNPGEIYSSFNLQLSNEYNYWNSYVDFIFPGMNPNSEIRLHDSYENYNFGYFVVPELPMLNYKVKVTNYARTKHIIYTQSYSQVWEYGNPGEVIYLFHNKTIELLSPANNQINVNDTTKFIFNDTEPGGVYVYKISPDSHFDYHKLNIITDKYLLTLKDFKTWGYHFTPNTTYYWGVIKYPGYRNIDEFASTQLKEDTVYKKIPASEWFTFTTQ